MNAVGAKKITTNEVLANALNILYGSTAYHPVESGSDFTGVWKGTFNLTEAQAVELITQRVKELEVAISSIKLDIAAYHIYRYELSMQKCQDLIGEPVTEQRLQTIKNSRPDIV